MSVQASVSLSTFLVLADADLYSPTHLAAVTQSLMAFKSIGRLHWRGSGVFGEGNMAGLERSLTL